MYRLFIAIQLKPAIIEQIQNICYGVKKARWAKENQNHLSLRFIGDCDNNQYLNIKSILNHIRRESFTISIKGVGYFPPRKKPKVLWIGIEESEELNSLYSEIQKSLKKISLPEEKRKFHPHITIARFRNGINPSELISFLTRNSLFKIDSIPVNEFYLYSSVLHREGAVHRIEETYLLI